MHASLRAVAALLFGSGFSALVYQTAWQRTFRLTFGSSTAASAAVLAVFLGGLGLGGWLLGKRIERSPRPLAVYANLELAIALLAAVSPFLSEGVHWLYLSLGGSTQLGTIGATFVRLVCTLLVIGPAAVLMGGTLPAVARAVVTEKDANRSRLAFLYALNTTGAVFGALVGPLVLFGLFGTRLTLWTAACINLLIAVIARAMARNLDPLPVVSLAGGIKSDAAEGDASITAEGDASVTADASAQSAGLATTPRSIVFVVAATVGFAFLAMELVWYRMLSPILGGSTITFGLILATALAGIGFGGYLNSRRAENRPISLLLLATTLALEALVIILPFAWGDDLALVVAHLRTMVNLGYGHLITGWLAVTFVVVFPASVVSGYQFPLLFALLGRGRAGVAEHVGITYAFNTIGTILGSLIGGFLLFPLLGAVASWRALCWLLVLISLLCVAASWRALRSRSGLALPLCVAAVALLFSTAKGPGNVWRHTPIGAGRVALSEKNANDVLAWKAHIDTAMVWQTDGLESTVALDGSNGYSFLVNGKSDGSIISDRSTQAFLGLLPAMLHGHPKQGFVIGLGTGMTAGLLGKVPGVEKVTVAELEPAILEVARRASPVNGNVLDNPRVDIQFGDGREILLTTKQKFDVIISEPSNPYRIGVASLFTKEFYEAANARLEHGGIFAQWVQGYEIDAEVLSMTIRTMRSVFPYVSVWGPQGSDLILTASEEPPVIDVSSLRSLAEKPEYKVWMQRAWGAEGAEAVLAHHLLAPELTDQLADQLPEPVNTDDLNYLELAYARTVGDNTYNALADIHETLDGKPHRPHVRGDVDWARVDDLRHKVEWPGYRGPPASKKAHAAFAGCKGNMQLAARLWPENEAPVGVVEEFVRADLWARQSNDAALPLAASLEARGFRVEALVVRAHLAGARGQFDEATRTLTAAIEGLRHEVYPLCDTIDDVFAQAQDLGRQDPRHAEQLLQAVMRGQFVVRQSEAQRQVTQSMLGAYTGNPARCVQALGEYRRAPLWEVFPLSLRASCLRDANEPDAPAALADLVDYAKHAPTSFMNRIGLMPPLKEWLKNVGGPVPQIQAAHAEAQSAAGGPSAGATGAGATNAGAPATTADLPAGNAPAHPGPAAHNNVATEAEAGQAPEAGHAK